MNTTTILTLPGEEIVYQADVEVICGHLNIKDESHTIYLTNYKLLLENKKNKSSQTIPLNCISFVGSLNNNTNKLWSWWNTYPTLTVIVKAKDFRKIYLTFKCEMTKLEFIGKIKNLSFWNNGKIGIKNGVFAFQLKKFAAMFNPIHSVNKEFDRLFKDLPFVVYSQGYYSKCKTYPEKFILPAKVVDKESEHPRFISDCSDFRSKNRIPVICWVDRETKATLSRSSQPQVGIRGKESIYDRQLLEYFRANNEKTEKGDIKMYIADARPWLNAYSNSACGGGYETTYTHPGCKVEFMDITNIHQVRSAFKKLECVINLDTTLSPSNRDIEGTQWYTYIQNILSSSNKIADWLQEGISVLVHCSDGWDRTTQLVSLVQLILDPFYRTFEGFAILIEKEWVSFGHQFGTRIGHGKMEGSSNDQSPIFLQFLDCVYQILEQNQDSFEFNQYYLIEIMDHVYSGLFGTFLVDNEYLDVLFKSREATLSLWPLLLLSRDQYRNNSYVPNKRLCVNTASSYIRFWQSYYERYKYHNYINNKTNNNLLVEVYKLNLLKVTPTVPENVQVESSLNSNPLSNVVIFRGDIVKPVVAEHENKPLMDIDIRDDYVLKVNETDSLGEKNSINLEPVSDRDIDEKLKELKGDNIIPKDKLIKKKKPKVDTDGFEESKIDIPNIQIEQGIPIQLSNLIEVEVKESEIKFAKESLRNKVEKKDREKFGAEISILEKGETPKDYIIFDGKGTKVTKIDSDTNNKGMENKTLLKSDNNPDKIENTGFLSKLRESAPSKITIALVCLTSFCVGIYYNL